MKIEPQHLGVGMYQHDLKKKTLEEALSEVVSECVSFVGVDLNTTSQCLLRYILHYFNIFTDIFGKAFMKNVIVSIYKHTERLYRFFN